MTAWINCNGEIFKDEEAAGERCRELIDEDCILDLLKKYLNSYWETFFNALVKSDIYLAAQIDQELFDMTWDEYGFMEVEVEDEENGE